MKVYLVLCDIDFGFIEDSRIRIDKIFRTRKSAKMYIREQRKPYRYSIKEAEIEE